MRARKATKATPASAERDPRDSDLGRIESIAAESRPHGQAAFIAQERAITTEHLAAAVFQQAKKPRGEPQFLQIVAKEDSATPKKSKPKAEPKLTRVAFKVSRLMEFCTFRELQNQTGHSVYDWALVVLKELMDNALDACEESEVGPVIWIDVKDGSITIQDNAGGIDPATVESILDYTVRVSSREALLAAMRKHTKPVAPKHLGMIGAEHFKQRFLAAGGNIDTFKYQLRKGIERDIPYVIEFAFDLHQSGLDKSPLCSSARSPTKTIRSTRRSA